MRSNRRALAGIMAGSAVFVVALGGALAGTARQGPAGQGVVGLMHAQLGDIEAVRHSVIRGDLDGLVEPARALAESRPLAGLPAQAERYYQELRKLAGQAASATDIEKAASTTAAMIDTCGRCHAEAGAKVNLGQEARPAPTPAQASSMGDHNWAAEVMAMGLLVPSEELWRRGARALAAMPLKPAIADLDQATRSQIAARETRLHELATRAGQTAVAAERAALYGEVLATCGGCHDLSGRVLGTGLPR